MRLATIATPQGPKTAIELDGQWTIVPLRMREDILAGWPGSKSALERAAGDANAQRVPTGEVKFLPPVPDPRKIICLGLNYKDHAAEGGVPVPRDPVLFNKFATALIGHEAAIVLPPVSREVDFEAELVVVIGKGGRNIREADAMSHVAGYTVGHDVSARDWQHKKDGKQWMVGKTFDTFAPLGPVLVTADEIPDPHQLGIRLRLNGQTMQDSNTSHMIFSVPRMIAYMAQVFTLEPGDIIFTGTPPGVGFARKPPVFLKAGDVVEVEIDRLGMLRNPVVQG